MRNTIVFAEDTENSIIYSTQEDFNKLDINEVTLFV